MIKKVIIKELNKALTVLGLREVEINLEHPADLVNGDYSCNIAMILGKQSGLNPKELAGQIKAEFEKKLPSEIKKVEVAGPGFINFYLSEKFFAESIKEILEKKEQFGLGDKVSGLKVIVEHTDANPFKALHIGHLMPNTIGEAIARIIEANGAEVKRACYQGDIGLHVAKAVWGLKQRSNLAEAYAHGNKAFEEDEAIKAEIIGINKKLYEHSDEELNKIYDEGRAQSLAEFEKEYERLGTKFDFNFFESETGQDGAKIVKENVGQVFEESDGAVIFPGEKYGLHTRVFINSQGLPTYEAKELGLAKKKAEVFPYDLSIVVTANEINDYFKVLLKAMESIFPDLAKKTKHVSHGILRLPTGKMSSRTGDVITASSLVDRVEELVTEKIAERDLPADEKKKIASQVAVGAIKYSILKQAIGRDIIFDFDKSLSFEGDSGPYLQYAHTRTKSILTKAKEVGIEPRIGESVESNEVIRLVYRLPEVIERAGAELAPQYVVTYLLELAGAFSSWYAREKIVDPNNPVSAERVALTTAVGQVLKNGLNLLGIQTPDKM